MWKFSDKFGLLLFVVVLSLYTCLFNQKKNSRLGNFFFCGSHTEVRSKHTNTQTYIQCALFIYISLLAALLSSLLSAIYTVLRCSFGPHCFVFERRTFIYFNKNINKYWEMLVIACISIQYVCRIAVDWRESEKRANNSCSAVTAAFDTWQCAVVLSDVIVSCQSQLSVLDKVNSITVTII